METYICGYCEGKENPVDEKEKLNETINANPGNQRDTNTGREEIGTMNETHSSPTSETKSPLNNEKVKSDGDGLKNESENKDTKDSKEDEKIYKGVGS